MKNLLIILSVLFLFSCELNDFDEPGNLVPETVNQDPDLPSIYINGTLLHAESFGDINNPIIVFLHGGPGSDYRSMISEKGVENASRYPNERTITNGGLSQLQDEYYCVFYDQRGGGLSPRFDKGKVTFDILLEDLNQIIDYYLQKKEDETGNTETQVYLMGWSYGGILATGYINEYPDKIKDVVLYEPGPLAKNVWEYLMDEMSSVFGQIGNDWLEEFLLSQDHITPDSHERADYQYMLLPASSPGSQPEFHSDPNAPLWRSGAIVSDDNLDFMESDSYDITSNLSAFNGNMLFIGSDKVIGEIPEYPGMQMEYYPSSELATVAGVGHTGPWEKSGEVATLIRNFFK